MASYTDAELQEIARWLKDGLSASKIAAAFSAQRGACVSRNAIIGIVHRNAMLGAMGFANGKGAPVSVKRVTDKRFRGERAGAMPAQGKASPEPVASTIDTALAAGDDGARMVAVRPRRDYSPARLPPRTPVGRQPHGVAMRFIDCLFSRCRAPLDLTLEGDPDNDEPGTRPGADMLCCGMRTRALRSYCTYHEARFRRRVFAAAG
jgi:GcrA cell cycle regulator